MKVLIFTEAGSDYGYGHLMRCLAFAQGFKERSVQVSFILRGDGDHSGLLTGFTHKQLEWLDKTNLKGVLNTDDIAIVDSYYATKELCTLIYERVKNVLFIDDYKRITYPGGVVFNGVIGAEKLDYPVENDIIYLLGSKYQPLRKEFWDVSEYVVRKSIKHIMITFGGSDISNETPKYIKKALEYYTGSRLSVIIGSGFKNVAQIEDASVSNKNVELIYQPDAAAMRGIMLRVDLAISAAGQTISELARIGVPTIGIPVAVNQENNMKFWEKSGFLLREKILENDIPFDLRKECSEIGRTLMDGQGVRRIMEYLLC